MNKLEFLGQLSKNLRKLPEAERKDALAYYEEYFEEAEETEEEIIKKLGSPQKVANLIMLENRLNEFDEASTKKKGSSIVATVLLSIFAAPIALPIAIALAAVVFAIVVVIFAVIFSLLAAGVVMTIAGVLTAFAGVTIITTQVSAAGFIIGMALVVLGLGILLTMSMFFLFKKIVNGIARLIRKQVEKRKNHA